MSLEVDLQTIKEIVREAQSREEALTRLKRTHGFSITEDQALRALNNALDIKFHAQAFAQKVAASYLIKAGRNPSSATPRDQIKCAYLR